MTETALVTSVKGNEVSVICKSEESCKGCSGLFCSAETHVITAKKNSSLEVQTGDLVDLYIPPGKTILQGFIVLVLPLILFILMFKAGGWIISGASEGIKVLFGLTGLAAGFGGSLLYGKINKNTSMPRVVGRRTS